MVCDSYPPAPPAGPPLLPNDPQAAWILVASLAGSWVLLLLFGVCVHFAEKRRTRKKEKAREERQNVFEATANFYEYDPKRLPPPVPSCVSPSAAEGTGGGDTQEGVALDAKGEPLSLRGSLLYGRFVWPGAPSPPEARSAGGAGRLQRLWLARGGVGGGKNTAAGERRHFLQAARAERAAPGASAGGGSS